MFQFKNLFASGRSRSRAAAFGAALLSAWALTAPLAPVAHAQSDAKAQAAAKLAKVRAARAANGPQAAGPQAATDTNTFLALDYDNTNGQYSIMTGNAHPFPNETVFFNTGTSYITFRDATNKVMWVNDTSAPTPGLANYTVQLLSSQPTTTTTIPGGFRTVYTLPEFVITQDVKINGTTLDTSNVLHQVTVQNTTNAPREFGVRYMWDWQIAGSDNSLFARRSPDTDFTNQFTTFNNPEFRLYEEIDDPQAPTFSIFGSVRDLGLNPPPTAPDQLRYSSWGLSVGSAWDFENTGAGSDSSVCYYWGFNAPRMLAPGETQLFAQYVTTQESAISLPAVRFSAPTYNVNETGTNANVTIERAGDTSAQVTVQIATSDGTATAGVDYSAVTQTVTFGPGEISKVVQIPIINDGDQEPDETITLTLSDPASAIIGAPGTAILTIRNFTNVAPVAVSANPNNGSAQADAARALRVVYSDANGALDIVQARVLLNESPNGANALYGIYDRLTNRLSLINDAGTSPVGSFAPGSNNVLTNNQGNLNCAATTVTLSGNTLIINWNFTPNGFFTGTKNIYGLARDAAGLASPLTNLGTFAITTNTGNRPPVVQSVTPPSINSQTSVARSFAVEYVDLDGASDIAQTRVLINNGFNGANALYALYNRATNQLFMFNDAGNALIGGFAPGSANVITNTQGSLNCAQTTVTSSGNTLTVNWQFTPNGFFTGTKNIYGFARDTAGLASAFNAKGTWRISANPANDPPVNSSLTPAVSSSAANAARSFTAVYADVEGATNIAQARILINTNLNGAGALYGYYDRVANKLYLFNDAGNNIVGGFAPGSANVISNAQGSLNCAQTSVSLSGTKLTINWNFTPKTAFIGDKRAYLLARDAAGGVAGFDQLATWRVTGTAPAPTQSVKPSANAS